MKILMLCPLLSGSSFVTSYLFSKMLEPEHTVDFVGPTFGRKPFVFEKDMNIDFIEPFIRKPYQIGVLSLIPKNLKRLEKKDYDAVHVFKLLPHTMPVAAMAKKKTKKPLILTVDDYDYASPKNIIKKTVLKWAERYYRLADRITVSSTGLQKIYGGEIIRQVVDERMYKNNPTGKAVRKKLNIDDKIVIMHIGTSYEVKGIHILIKAVQRLKNNDVILCVFNVGDPKYLSYLKNISGKETIFLKQIPFRSVPEYTAAADIYTIPTLSTPYTDVQTPAKIFDAMILEKAIVATNISDNRLFLDNGKCGLLCKPGDVDSLYNKIKELIENRELRKKLGRNARKKYFKEYSQKIMSRKLKNLYNDLL